MAFKGYALKKTQRGALGSLTACTITHELASAPVYMSGHIQEGVGMQYWDKTMLGALVSLLVELWA